LEPAFVGRTPGESPALAALRKAPPSFAAMIIVAAKDENKVKDASPASLR
jgi:hypothetical protein